MPKIKKFLNMKSKFYFFTAVAMMMATGCAKTFGGSNGPAHGDKDEIRFSSYVNVMTKSGTQATETFDNGEGFVVIGGSEINTVYASMSFVALAADTFNATQVFNEGDADDPVWVPKEISSEDLAELYESLVSDGYIEQSRLEEIVEKSYNSNFKASWPLASMYYLQYQSSDLFDKLNQQDWQSVQKYWNYSKSYYMFYALSPASIINDAGIVIHGSLTSTRDLCMDGEKDIMTAQTIVQNENFGKPVNLNFSHLGSKLEFNLKNACAGPIEIHAAVFGGGLSKLAKFQATISNDFLISDTGLQEADDVPDEFKYHYYIAYITENLAEVMETKYNLGEGYIKNSGFVEYAKPVTIPTDGLPLSIIVCPQSIEVANNFVKLAYTLGDDTNLYMADIPLSYFEYNGEPLTEWEAGKKYTYNISIKHDNISFNVSIEDWVNGEEATVVTAGEELI